MNAIRTDTEKKKSVSLSLARNGPVDPPRSWVTGEHHRYLHNYLAVALTVPRGKHVEAGTATYRVPIRQHFSGYRWRRVVARRGDVTRRKKIVSLSSVRLADLQGRSSRDARRKCNGATQLARSIRAAHARALLRAQRPIVGEFARREHFDIFKRRASPFVSFSAKDASRRIFGKLCARIAVPKGIRI